MFTKICLCHHIAHFPSRLWMAGWPPVSNLCAPTHNQQNHILTAVLKSCGTGCGNSFAVKSDLNTFHFFSTAYVFRGNFMLVVIISVSWLLKLHCCSFRKGVFLPRVRILSFTLTAERHVVKYVKSKDGKIFLKVDT
jgi:hypothetical protein